MQSLKYFRCSFFFFFWELKESQGLGGNVLMNTACPPEGIHHALTSKWWWLGREDSVLLFPHLHVDQHASAHGLCVLAQLNYDLFPGKSPMVCRSCFTDRESSTTGWRSCVPTPISLPCPILSYFKSRLNCSPHLPTATRGFWFSVFHLQAYFLLLRCLLKFCVCPLPNYFL